MVPSMPSMNDIFFLLCDLRYLILEGKDVFYLFIYLFLQF